MDHKTRIASLAVAAILFPASHEARSHQANTAGAQAALWHFEAGG
jgi:hypothetical protein